MLANQLTISDINCRAKIWNILPSFSPLRSYCCIRKTGKSWELYVGADKRTNGMIIRIHNDDGKLLSSSSIFSVSPNIIWCKIPYWLPIVVAGAITKVHNKNVDLAWKMLESNLDSDALIFRVTMRRENDTWWMLRLYVSSRYVVDISL